MGLSLLFFTSFSTYNNASQFYLHIVSASQAIVLNRGGSIKEFADPKLEGEYSVDAFDLTFQLALSCTSAKQQRPSMEQVVVNLEKALDISTRERASTPEATPDGHSIA